jgi:hypothetical protein
MSDLQRQLNSVLDGMIGDITKAVRAESANSRAVNIGTQYHQEAKVINNYRTYAPPVRAYVPPVDAYAFPRKSIGVEPVITSTYERQVIKQEPKQKTNSMFDNIPGLNLASGKLSGNRVALTISGDLAFRTGDGSYVTLSKDADGNKTQVNVGDLKFDVDFYKLPTQVLEVGDLIELDGQLLFVEEKNNGGLKFVNPITGNKSSKLAQSNILGLFFYTKVVSIFNMGQQAGGQGVQGFGLNGLNPLTLMMLSGKDGLGSGDSSSNLMEMMVMSQLVGAPQGGAQQAINPMMLMALSKGGSKDSLLPLLMMQGQLGGAGTGLFAPIASPVAAAPTKAARVAPKKVASAKKAAPAKAASKVAVKGATKVAAKSTTKASKA